MKFPPLILPKKEAITTSGKISNRKAVNIISP
jgi:hypothetical protein